MKELPNFSEMSYAECEKLYHEDIKSHRGLVLEWSIQIDGYISQTLTNLLGNGHNNSAIERHFFSSRLTFEQKIKLYSDLFELSEIPGLSEKSQVKADLEFIRVLRNKMAHSFAVMTEDVIRDYDRSFLVFTSFEENKPKPIYIYLQKEAKQRSSKKGEYNFVNIATRVNRCVEDLKTAFEASKGNSK